jgi:hypothetical protein
LEQQLQPIVTTGLCHSQMTLGREQPAIDSYEGIADTIV